ncbi:MAG: hypothetical protein PHH82_00255 [Candidatus ainarchaeum sp.]|nr:hypothetical protein [Candidatus ainarchaeum sp.]
MNGVVIEMGLFDKIKSLFSKKTEEKTKEHEVKTKKEPENPEIFEIKGEKQSEPKKSIHNDSEEPEEVMVDDLWNYIDPMKNTQAYHIISVVGFEEWVDMQTIKDRVKQMFFIEYKNEKSLYPYIKTLVDIGLLETNAVGGKRQWKKREILINIKKEKAMLTTKVKTGLKLTK